MPDERALGPASGDTCVYVIGMHRSGTSATSGLLSHLGLGAPKVEDLLKETPGTLRGTWESTSLNLLDERLLGHLGGSWLAPPALSPGWQDDSALDPFKAEAYGLFAAVFDPRPIVWKDPRASILLPFWRTVIKPPVASIFVYRDPSEVVASLHARDELRMTHGFALWERYVRSAAANLVGLPTFVLSYESLLESPTEWCDRLVTFLADVSVTIDRSRIQYAMGFLDQELRHARAPASDSSVPESTRDLFRNLGTLEGPHHPWTLPELGGEPTWVDDVLAMRFEIESLNNRLLGIETSRTMQWARQVHKVVRLARFR